MLSQRQKVAILIDNLDDAWGPGHHIKQLSDLIFGLLQVSEAVSEGFQHQDHWRKRVNVCVTVFLRSDIFAFIQPLAPQQDRLPIERIVWDSALLLKVLNQRIELSSPKQFDAQEIWRQLFPSEVVGVPTSDFILRTVLQRPRDAIYLVRAAVSGAINRDHRTVTEGDFLDAREKYSQFVFKSIVAEDDPRKGQLEAVLYEFAGAPKVNKLSEVRSRIARAGVTDMDVEFYIDLLCDVSFLQIETAHGFINSTHEANRQILRQVARRLATESGKGEESFAINPAFFQVLQIE